MIRCNVGLSRKVTRDYQSSGYSVNLDAEIGVAADDPETFLGKVQELFGLAEEALQVEIDRDQGDAAIGRRDEEPVGRQTASGPSHEDRPVKSSTQARSQASNSPATRNGNDSATPKQISFIQSLANRQRLSTVQLEGVIGNAVGLGKTLHHLSKKDAGVVIDALNQAVDSSSNGRGR